MIETYTIEGGQKDELYKENQHKKKKKNMSKILKDRFPSIKLLRNIQTLMSSQYWEGVIILGDTKSNPC